MNVQIQPPEARSPAGFDYYGGRRESRRIPWETAAQRSSPQFLITRAAGKRGFLRGPVARPIPRPKDGLPCRAAGRPNVVKHHNRSCV